MYEWIISYEDDNSLNEILKVGTVEFEPEFKELNFIIMKTYLTKETILEISGVTECRMPMEGSVWV